MLLIALTVLVAISVGMLTGGALRNLSTLRIRFGWLALAGVLMQVAPVPRSAAYAVLVASFVLLILFAVANLGTAGFLLILTGLCLNALVIAADHGMPVTRDALVRSNQTGRLTELVTSGGAKHHLATQGTRLLLLGDVMGVGWKVDQAISLGDVCVHLGVAWSVVIAMRPQRYAPSPVRHGSPRVA